MLTSVLRGADFTVDVIREKRVERIDVQFESPGLSVAAAKAVIAGALAFNEGERAGLNSKGWTAGGEDLARRRGGEGVVSESESDISSMSIHSDCGASCDAEPATFGRFRFAFCGE